VVVENRPGADGITGVTSFVNAHDDHMLLFSFAGPISINPLIYDKLPYDPVRDLVPIAAAIDNFFAIAVTTPTGVRSIDAFVAAARAAPGASLAGICGFAYYIFLALQVSTVSRFHAGAQDFAENRIQVVVTAPFFPARGPKRTGNNVDGDQPATFPARP
jgi:hypothetical protein